MYSKVTVLGHPIHPMLVAFPVAFYVGALVGFIVYAANSGQFWLNLAIALSVAGAVMAIVAALPGFVDLFLGVRANPRAYRVGLAHMTFNVIALVLFIVTALVYVGNWDGPATGAALGIVLTAIGVASTVVAGWLGWTMVQTHHVGIKPFETEQALTAPATLPTRTPPAVPHQRAS